MPSSGHKNANRLLTYSCFLEKTLALVGAQGPLSLALQRDEKLHKSLANIWKSLMTRRI